MFLHKDVESWARVSAKAVLRGSPAQAENVLCMALADIQRLGEELADAKDMLRRANLRKPTELCDRAPNR